MKRTLVQQKKKGKKQPKQKQVEQDEEPEVVSCGLTGCTDNVEDNSVQCLLCKRWFHAECADLADEEIHALSNHQIRWVCDECFIGPSFNKNIDRIKCSTNPEGEIVNDEEKIKLENEKKELEQKLKVSSDEVKNHQNIEKELVQKNLDMLGRIAALESELANNSSSKNDENKILRDKVTRLEKEIEQHEKIGEEMMTDISNPGKDVLKQKKAEITSLKKQVGDLETEMNKLRVKLDSSHKELQTKSVEANREKDINNILIEQIKKQANKSESEAPEKRKDGTRNNSIVIDGDYDVRSDAGEQDTDFCKREFLEGPKKCSEEECRANHNIDFSKKGVCIFEFQKEGSCKRKENCWFLHEIPMWYRSSPEIREEMKQKIEKMKGRSKTKRNENQNSGVRDQIPNTSIHEPPPVWQNQITNRARTNVSGASMYLTQSLSPMRTIQKHPQNETSDDFLELITKYVEERLKRQSEVD